MKYIHAEIGDKQIRSIYELCSAFDLFAREEGGIDGITLWQKIIHAIQTRHGTVERIIPTNRPRPIWMLEINGFYFFYQVLSTTVEVGAIVSEQSGLPFEPTQDLLAEFTKEEPEHPDITGKRFTTPQGSEDCFNHFLGVSTTPRDELLDQISQGIATNHTRAVPISTGSKNNTFLLLLRQFIVVYRLLPKTVEVSTLLFKKEPSDYELIASFTTTETGGDGNTSDKESE